MMNDDELAARARLKTAVAEAVDDARDGGLTDEAIADVLRIRGDALESTGSFGALLGHGDR